MKKQSEDIVYMLSLSYYSAYPSLLSALYFHDLYFAVNLQKREPKPFQKLRSKPSIPSSSFRSAGCLPLYTYAFCLFFPNPPFLDFSAKR
ncbi:hypothetical protein PO124_04930 [Bacillus licheniformis]|nr:hypothetical protein [Bacillus licheniformis]